MHAASISNIGTHQITVSDPSSEDVTEALTHDPTPSQPQADALPCGIGCPALIPSQLSG